MSDPDQQDIGRTASQKQGIDLFYGDAGIIPWN